MTNAINTSNDQNEAAIDWAYYSSAWEASGEPQRQFCKHQGIPYGSFVYWRAKLAKTPAISSMPSSQSKGFMPVRVSPSPSLGSDGIHITFPNGIAVHITSATDKGLLTDVLTLLGSV